MSKEQLINGLVILGGRSTRMGEDKSEISYHGIPQREYVAALLNRFTEAVFIACRQDQVGQIETSFPLLPDIHEGIGPMAAIIAAQKYKPQAAWLAIAVDFPLIDEDTIGQLLKNRDISEAATTFINPVTGSPEPLMTLWEPAAHPTIMEFFYRKNYSLRRVLEYLPVHLISPPNPVALKNVNRPEDRDEIFDFLKK